MNLSNVFGLLRNQPQVPKALLRVLKNLEDQTGCIAQVFIASVNPADGTSSIQKYVFSLIVHIAYRQFCFKVLSRLNRTRVEL